MEFHKSISITAEMQRQRIKRTIPGIARASPSDWNWNWNWNWNRLHVCEKYYQNIEDDLIVDVAEMINEQVKGYLDTSGGSAASKVKRQRKKS